MERADGPACDSRRRLLIGGLRLAAAGSVPMVSAAPRPDDEADWVPSERFVADLPRQMQAGESQSALRCRGRSPEYRCSGCFRRYRELR